MSLIIQAIKIILVVLIPIKVEIRRQLKMKNLPSIFGEDNLVSVGTIYSKMSDITQAIIKIITVWGVTGVFAPNKSAQEKGVKKDTIISFDGQLCREFKTKFWIQYLLCQTIKKISIWAGLVGLRIF